MRALFSPSTAKGSVKVPPSKSMAHRLLLCAAMAKGTSTVKGISDCEDVRATLACLRSLGVSFSQNGDTVTVTGKNFAEVAPTGILDCRESGSTLRFLIPPVALSGNPAVFCGSGRLMERPLQVYRDLFEARGLSFLQNGKEVRIGGKLPAGIYELPGDVSSQFVTGLLLALPHLEKESEIRLFPPVESRSYIDMTVSAVEAFGGTVIPIGENAWRIPGNQNWESREVTVEGDHSNAAFLGAFNLFGGKVSLKGLSEESRQGDRVWFDLLQRIATGNASISLADCPDLGPLLFAVAGKYGAVFTDVSRLRLKESDRIESMREELSAFGVKMKIEENRVEILPGVLHAPCRPLCGHNDHRVVMALSVLLSEYGGEIEGAEAVKKSYPGFFEDLSSLGIQIQQKTE